MKIFYKIWADVIHHFFNAGKGEEMKWTWFVIIVLLFSMNVGILTSVVLLLTGFDTFEFIKSFIPSFFSSDLKIFRLLFSVFFLYFPIGVFVYYKVLRNNNYLILMKKYEYKKGKYFYIYFGITVASVYLFGYLNEIYGHGILFR